MSASKKKTKPDEHNGIIRKTLRLTLRKQRSSNSIRNLIFAQLISLRQCRYRLISAYQLFGPLTFRISFIISTKIEEWLHSKFHWSLWLFIKTLIHSLIILNLKLPFRTEWYLSHFLVTISFMLTESFLFWFIKFKLNFYFTLKHSHDMRF